MGINSLLSEVGYISKKYDEIYKNTGGYFNIFSIANIGYDEISICRVIKELIDPKGSHYQGAAFTKFSICSISSATGILFAFVSLSVQYRAAAS